MDSNVSYYVFEHRIQNKGEVFAVPPPRGVDKVWPPQMAPPYGPHNGPPVAPPPNGPHNGPHNGPPWKNDNIR